jgi:hypothetical protein
MRDLVDQAVHAGLMHAIVAELPDGGPILALLPSGRLVECARLQVADTGTLTLAVGDEILIQFLGEDAAVVIGRIGGVVSSGSLEPGDLPDELVIEARRSLTLRVGDGSITIREDGRILIKGKDLVSHAKGMNRIRGGSVSIN